MRDDQEFDDDGCYGELHASYASGGAPSSASNGELNQGAPQAQDDTFALVVSRATHKPSRRITCKAPPKPSGDMRLIDACHAPVVSPLVSTYSYHQHVHCLSPFQGNEQGNEKVDKTL